MIITAISTGIVAGTVLLYVIGVAIVIWLARRDRAAGAVRLESDLDAPGAIYRVCFDGKWQQDFDEREDALDWARAVAETGRIVHVAMLRRRWLSFPRLIAVFPESEREIGKRLWWAREQGWWAASGK